MSDVLGSMAASASGMQVQSERLRHVSENIANADTPGYRRKTIAFRDMADGTVQADRVQLDRRELPRVYDPGHPMADDTGFYDGSTVDLIIEVADAREAQRSYEANLKIFDQSRQMAQGLLELLRR
ncbi:Flagellar basal-body rod protein FlgC [Rhodobacteraceae bacterium THAF1]|uniref:flagellar basal body rod protein FlgC n=1 Tax=Palleronia sp. THAF1 TaxID=2587842 RepID=UPI000F3EE29F|nr:flagellar basal body rod protein FlgC [Palleronia sp. THAF1]QFU10290.1 Flagellar basal-body rod protein FlgC [Palleronia sp. THAF1]VDC16805.1 Flagellar basal-body rod protein FlgC [Rhodobacteraceae bacterium THAF1]